MIKANVLRINKYNFSGYPQSHFVFRYTPNSIIISTQLLIIFLKLNNQLIDFPAILFIDLLPTLSIYKFNMWKKDRPWRSRIHKIIIKINLFWADIQGFTEGYNKI